MRKRKTWRQHGGVPPAVWEELEHWLRVLLTVGAALLLYAALESQLARADGAHAAPVATPGDAAPERQP